MELDGVINEMTDDDFYVRDFFRLMNAKWFVCEFEKNESIICGDELVMLLVWLPFEICPN